MRYSTVKQWSHEEFCEAVDGSGRREGEHTPAGAVADAAKALVSDPGGVGAGVVAQSGTRTGGLLGAIHDGFYLSKANLQVV
jgi:hypothetical protein